MTNIFTFASQTLTDANLFGGINYLADLNTGEEFTIGNTASASVKFVTDVQLPLYTKDNTNGTFTWTRDSVSRGRYYITEVVKQEGKYEVTAYDAMILADANISALSLSLPATVSTLASAIASFLGCTVSGTVTNGSLSVSTLADDLTVRKLLGYVAEASGCSVKIDGSDHLCFMYYADSGITITASEYITLDLADYTCDKIDNVTIYNTEGDLQASAGSGSNALYIGGNPLLDGATNTNATNILNKVKDFQYAPFKCEMFEENGLEVGTIATFGTAASLVMHVESSESGALASSVGNDNRAAYNKDILTVVNETNAIAVNASTIAGQAAGILSDMQNAATAAGTTLNGIYATAEQASDTLAGMQAAATAAGTTLNGIYADAEQASADAAAASQSAAAAQVSASSAQYSLSEVERVVDALNWIAEHGSYTLTQDTEVVPGKFYFEKNGDDFENVTPPAGSDPSALGLYELESVDSSISNYVASHVSLDSNGLVIQTDGVSSKVRISGEGVSIREGTSSLASFGANGIRIGESNTMNAVKIAPGEMSILTDQGAPFFLIKGTQTSVTSEAVVAGGETSFSPPRTITLVGSIPAGTAVHVPGVMFQWWKYATPLPTISVTGCTYDIVQDGTSYCYVYLHLPDIYLTYGTSASYSYPMTMEYYTSDGGPYTTVYTASLTYDGSRTITLTCGRTSGQLFYETIYGWYGDITAEITDAEAPSFTLGTRAGSDGALSLSAGLSLYASQNYQAAFGKYNAEDQNGDYVLFAGKGSSDLLRSNAFAVTWDGDIHLALDTSAASGTTDGDIYDALVALGWDSDVII